jgi:hypothetical protein
VAAGKGQSVTQEIAMSVKGDKVECAINGTVVASYDKASLVAKASSSQRTASTGSGSDTTHEATVTGFGMTKN